MYAVIKAGGKQYRVSPGDVIEIEKIEANAGEMVEFSEVLMVGDSTKDYKDYKIGAPLIEGARVRGEVLRQVKGEKIIVFKFKRRKGYRRKRGHRQKYTAVKIKEIQV